MRRSQAVCKHLIEAVVDVQVPSRAPNKRSIERPFSDEGVVVEPPGPTRMLSRTRLGSRRMLTLCYDENMSEKVSVRLEDSLAQRLRLRARAAGETLSDRLRRYADEGVRRDEHPLITFRDGPTGRRAGLVGGPDVWEAAMWMDDLSEERDPVSVLVEDGTHQGPGRRSTAVPGRLSRWDRRPHRTSPQRNRGGGELLKLLLDEMYPPVLATDLRAVDIEAFTVVELGLAGRADPDVLAAAIAEGFVLLTENVADFARIATEHLSTGDPVDSHRCVRMIRTCPTRRSVFLMMSWRSSPVSTFRSRRGWPISFVVTQRHGAG